MTSEARRTPLYDEHKQLGARLVPFAGFEMPIQYAGIVAEHQAVRERAGLFDVCHMGELELSGPNALDVVDYLVTNDIRHAEDGQAIYTCACAADGGILDDLIVYRRSAESVLVVCNASNHGKMAAHFAQAARGRCSFVDRSDELGLLALQGPKALDTLDRAGSTLAPTAEALKSFRFAEARVAGIDCTVARTGYTGEDGVEIFAAASAMPALWRALLDAGKDDGVSPVGLGARDTLRLEARLSLYGNELDETTNPLEAGLGWVVKLSKPDFLGQQTLLSVSERGPARALVGFVMTGRGIARHGYPLCDASGSAVGVCTSGGPSPTLGKNIGLGYVPREVSSVGTVLSVDCRGKLVAAEVVKTPFYRRPRPKN